MVAAQGSPQSAADVATQWLSPPSAGFAGWCDGEAGVDWRCMPLIWAVDTMVLAE